VPLDPTYPRERLANMVEDARPRVLVAHKPTRDRVPVVSGSRVVWLDEDAGAIAGQPDTNPRSNVTADNLLYVIYTSGSTGRPKGIALPHRALTNLIQWHLDTIAEGRGVLQFASLSFDASFKEMFAAWAHGRYVATRRSSSRISSAGPSKRRFCRSSSCISGPRVSSSRRARCAPCAT
jgi:non-ribosomal peptide synthetase component F